MRVDARPAYLRRIEAKIAFALTVLGLVVLACGGVTSTPGLETAVVGTIKAQQTVDAAGTPVPPRDTATPLPSFPTFPPTEPPPPFVTPRPECGSRLDLRAWGTNIAIAATYISPDYAATLVAGATRKPVEVCDN